MTSFTSIVTALFLSVAAPAQAKLTIGDNAPELAPLSWLKGGPVPRFDKERIYVVEFWATWCGPCIAAFPHLSALAKKYEGDVTLIGVAASERGEPLDVKLELEEFMAQHSKLMNYPVAHDETKSMATTWMEAADQIGIPVVFVIDRTGRVAFIGHPLTLEDALARIVAGTWDMAAHRDEFEREALEHATARREHRRVSEAFAAAQAEGRWNEALALADQARAGNLGNPLMWQVSRIRILAKLDRSSEMSSAAKDFLARWHDKFYALLALVAGGLGEEPEFQFESVDFWRSVLARCDELTPAPNRRPHEVMFLSLLAKGHRAVGNLERASEVEKNLVERAEAPIEGCEGSLTPD